MDARDNTGTTYTSSDKGPPIWWLRGGKAADNYQDFYDGSWDSESGRNESGNAQTTGCGQGGRGAVWTGSNNDGTKDGNFSLGGSANSARTGGLNCSNLDPLSSNSSTARGIAKQLYALSPVIKLIEEVAVQGVSIESSPTNATSGYAAGETIRVRVDFFETVSVMGTPYVVLDIAGAARRAVYASGSGTRYLNFEYTVQASDFDSNGISLCSSRLLDPGCGRISLGDGRISAQSDGLAAELDLPALGNQSDHKVDGMPNFTPNPGLGPMANPGAGEVALNSPLTPPGLVRPASFRLLFLTSSRNATSAAIADYNNHAISDAGSGHSAIRGFRTGFRVIASTATVDARDNAALTARPGLPIYWIGSNNKVADGYADLLDGSWDSESPTDKNGNASSVQFVWTGSGDDGTEGTLGSVSVALGTDEGTVKAAFGALNVSTSGDNSLRAGLSNLSTLSPLYALSQVLKLPPQATRQHNPTEGLAPTSRPREGDTYRLGETFVFPFIFTEPVVVRGVPTMPLKLDSGYVTTRYVSGSGTNRLYFAYTVQVGDYDEDGPFSLFSAGASYMTLDGASVRALSDGSPTNLITDIGWNFPYNVYGPPHKMEGRPAFATRASISSSPDSGTTYGAGETITVRLAMNDDVLVTGRPHVLLAVGGTRKKAVYSGTIGSATDALEFSYVVQAGDVDIDGVALCARGGRLRVDPARRRLDPGGCR